MLVLLCADVQGHTIAREAILIGQEKDFKRCSKKCNNKPEK